MANAQFINYFWVVVVYRGFGGYNHVLYVVAQRQEGVVEFLWQGAEIVVDVLLACLVDAAQVVGH